MSKQYHSKGSSVVRRRFARRSSSTIVIVVSGLVSGLMAGTLRADFILLDNFNSGTLGGALTTSNPAWSATAVYTVATDPTDPANRVASAVQAGTSNNQTALLPFGSGNVIPNGASGTVFFRLMRGPTAATNFLGYVKGNTASDFNERQSGIGSNGGSTQPVLMRGGASNSLVTTSGFTNLPQDTWYRYWVVMDNSAETFTIYSQREGSSPLPQTLLSNAGGTTQTFIGGSTSLALQSLFFAQSSGGGNMDFYFDDIYIDPTAANLSVPPIIVPEPSAALLGCVGLAALAVRGFRRRT